MREDRRFRIASHRLADQHVVINQNGAVIHLQENRGGLGVVDYVARDPRALIAEVDPDSKCALLLVIHASDQVFSDDRVYAMLLDLQDPATVVICVYDHGGSAAYLAGHLVYFDFIGSVDDWGCSVWPLH